LIEIRLLMEMELEYLLANYGKPLEW